MNKLNRAALLMVMVASSVALTACGNDDDEDTASAPAPTPTAPATGEPLVVIPGTASATSAGFVSYLEVLATPDNLSEIAEPIDATAFVPPASNDDEPEPVS